MKDLLYRAGFHGIALMHNQHPIGNIRHHPHIVGDENHPHLHLLLQHLNQLQDLGLNGDIQRRGGFVRNEHRRTARQRHRNHHRWRMPPES